MDPKSHWETVYETKQPTEVSWYRAHLDLSLRLIEEAAGTREARIIDVGGGESTLVDDLIGRGFSHVSVLDLSQKALDVAKERLVADAAKVDWLCADVTTASFARHSFDVWHDRAVFHFLTDPSARRAYVRQVSNAVRPGGHVIVATFGPDGPAQCSGLDVLRYDAEGLHAQFGPRFRLVKHATEMHETPSGSVQQFVYCYCSLPAREESST